MEDFSSLPRLYRDSAINELWEGPRNVLLTQVHNDFKKTAASYKPSEFVSNVLSGADSFCSLKSWQMNWMDTFRIRILLQWMKKPWRLQENGMITGTDFSTLTRI